MPHRCANVRQQYRGCHRMAWVALFASSFFRVEDFIGVCAQSPRKTSRATEPRRDARTRLMCPSNRRVARTPLAPRNSGHFAHRSPLTWSECAQSGEGAPSVAEGPNSNACALIGTCKAPRMTVLLFLWRQSHGAMNAPATVHAASQNRSGSVR
jgi:hypothetical protein